MKHEASSIRKAKRKRGTTGKGTERKLSEETSIEYSKAQTRGRPANNASYSFPLFAALRIFAELKAPEDPADTRDRSTLVGGEETSGSAKSFPDSSREYVRRASRHTFGWHACAHARISDATRKGEREHSRDERDKFIMFWKELAITGSNMQ